MSLHEKSLLVDLTLSGVTTARTDKSITRQVLRDQVADREAGRWVSRLWPKEALDPIKTLDSQIRAFHYEKTLPWLDKGGRILATRAFTGYIDTMRGFRVNREQLVRDHFLARYDHWLNAARTMRGRAFNPAEYEPQHRAAQRFRCEINASPVPHRDDFRVSLAGADLQEMRDQLDERLAEAERIARADLLNRIAGPVSKLVERLADPDARFQDTLVTNLRDLAAAIPDLNLLDDPAIEALRQQIATLARVNPDSLRESKSDRSRAVAKASSILSTMAPWLDAETLAAAA